MKKKSDISMQSMVSKLQTWGIHRNLQYIGEIMARAKI